MVAEMGAGILPTLVLRASLKSLLSFLAHRDRMASYRESESFSVLSNSLQPHELYSPWNFQARILKWVAVPFSRRSSQPRDQTQVSHIAD